MENAVRIVSLVFLVGLAVVLGITASWVFPLFIVVLTGVISFGLHLQESGMRTRAQLDRSGRRRTELTSR